MPKRKLSTGSIHAHSPSKGHETFYEELLSIMIIRLSTEDLDSELINS